VLIVDYHDFGYRRIKVQRPLRLLARITEEGITALQNSKAFARLDEGDRSGWLTLLRKHLGQTHPYAWFASLPSLAKKAGLVKLAKPLAVALEDALGVRVPDAPVVLDVDGTPVADKDLEEFENVPLGQSIDAYMAADVLPHAPDAWVDESYTDDRDGQVGKVGYEINFNRHFYKYVPPRDLHTIDAELKAVEAEISALLEEVAE
jgi:type I restriction enzyme M protein